MNETRNEYPQEEDTLPISTGVSMIHRQNNNEEEESYLNPLFGEDNN